MKHFLFILFVFLAACGSVENTSLNSADNSGNVTPGVENVFFFATDFASAGQLYTASMDPVGSLVNSGVTSLGSSAGIHLYDGLIYVLHDYYSNGSSDNVQIIDPSNGYATVNQWSTGNGTNPSDIVAVGSKAYISLYNPESDQTGASVDAGGNPSDLIVMNLATGAINKRISFSAYLNDDGNKTAMAGQMILVGTKLYVAIQDQDVEGFAYLQTAPGKIAVVDTTTDTVEKVITLKGRNPAGLAYLEAQNKLFVALQAPFDPDTFENEYATSPYGGIEIVSLTDDSTVLINDEDLGGYVERLAGGDGVVYSVVSKMDPVTFAFTSDIFKMADDNQTSLGATVFLNGSQDVRDIATDAEGRLWVSRRSINANDGSASDPQVEVFDAAGTAVGSTMVPVVPITSIAIGNI